MWTSFKALYLKQSPLTIFTAINQKMGQQFFWKLAHFEDIPWEIFMAEDICKALQVYSFEGPSEEKKSEQEWVIPRITRGNNFSGM